MSADQSEWGCSDGSCDIRDRRGGQHTNGGCHCLEDVPFRTRLAIRRYIHDLRTQVRELKAQIAEKGAP